MSYYCMQAIYDADAPPDSGEWQWKYMATTPLWDSQDPQIGEAFLETASQSPGCLLAWLEGKSSKATWFGASPWDLLAECWEQRDLVGFLTLLGGELLAWGVWCHPDLLRQPWPANATAVLRGPATVQELNAFGHAAANVLRGTSSAADYDALNPRLDEWAGPKLPESMEDGLRQLRFLPEGDFWWFRDAQPLFFPEEEDA